MLENNVPLVFIHSNYIHCQAPGAAGLDCDTFRGVASPRPGSKGGGGCGGGGGHSPGRGLDQGGGVQVVDLVELQQRGQVLELLVADLKAAVGQGVYDVVGNAGVLGHREDVVPRAGGRVPHQEHAVPLPLQPRLRLRPGHRAHVPAGAVRRIETSGGGHGSGRGRGRKGRKEGEEPEGPGGGRAPEKRRPGQRGPGGGAGWGRGGSGSCLLQEKGNSGNGG